MQSKSTIAVALLAAATPLVNAGSTIIKNQCSFPVYMWTVSSTPGEMKTIDVGDTYSESYLINPDGGGISQKIATNPSDYGAITQLEYTMSGPDLWYDISNINGAPFTKWGFDLVTSDASCPNVLCASGVEQCDAVYNTPSQNAATHHCFPDSDIVLSLCSQKGGNTNTNVDVTAKKHHNKHHNKHHKGGAAPPAPAPPAPVPTVSYSSIVEPSVSVGAYGPSTTFFTQVVTQMVTARAAEPTLQARHIHEHGHAHAHHRS